ncbi:MAG: imidazole glycerol phosphate synthase subunit HisH [Deltaproteobacteria bacterium]|nr:MAG: imidazole glycerol phosphate synthase subunit HisH [Deltaproteobacteria bacterium]
MSRPVVIIDYDSGNLRSVQKALESVGTPAVLTRDPGLIKDAGAVVLPGQGAFRDCVTKLENYGLFELVRDKIEEDVPFLGICVGFQLLFEESEEHGVTPGFGVFKGKVVRFPHDMRGEDGSLLKVPHMGWNSLKKVRDVDLLGGVNDGDYVYFVHSYYPVPEEEGVIATKTTYGLEFVSSVARGNLYACQFHPEKSQRVGLEILRAFWAKASAAIG